MPTVSSLRLFLAAALVAVAFPGWASAQTATVGVGGDSSGGATVGNADAGATSGDTSGTVSADSASS
ncbi:MAG: hypothetical protein ACRDM9_03205, partial [Gaiellaceae bacterium]